MSSWVPESIRRGWYSPTLRRRVLISFLGVFTLGLAVLIAAWTLAATSRRSIGSVTPSASLAAAVFNPENEKSKPSRPSRARGRG